MSEEIKNDMKRVNIRVSPDVHEWFRVRSKKTGVPMSALMFIALESYIQQQILLPHIPDMVEELRKQE